MTKIGTEVAHVTHDLDITFKVMRSKVNLQGAGAYCGCLPHSLPYLQLSSVSEMTYTVSSGTLNSTIPYHLQLL